MTDDALRQAWREARAVDGTKHAPCMGMVMVGDLMAHEIERQRARAEAAEKDAAKLREDIGPLLADMTALEAENEQLRQDAERYRWIRDNPWPPILEADIVLRRNARWDAEIDAAIDAAITAGG